MTTPKRYLVPSRFSERKFFERIRMDFDAAKEAATATRETYFDTFDWRLFEQSLTLAHGQGRLALRRLPTGELVKAAEALEPPRFAGDLADEEFRRRLSSVTDVRALLPLFDAERRVLPIRILDRREKTVARIEVEDVEVASGATAGARLRNIVLRPVRGYDENAAGLARWLDASGYAAEDGDHFARLAEAAGKKPGDYTSKLRFALDPAAEAYDVLVHIFRFLAGVMRRNEEGVRRDIDTEFLHDWRVATRRTRAGLGQMRKVVPKAEGKRFRKVFADFGERTNRLRDLDVYLLKADEYRALVPEGIRGDIDPLFDYVREERAGEFDGVRRWMDSGEYKDALAGWERFLDKPRTEEDARARSRLPIVDVAGWTIRARFEDVVERGREASSNPDDAKLHTLRIECKKLRYLLEFFSSLYPAEDVAKLVKQLKLLQDNLGRHQDIVVQQAGLRSFAEAMSSLRRGSERTAVAVGALVGALEKEKNELRAAFGGVFAGFASAENARLVNRIRGSAPESMGGAGDGTE